MENEFRDREFAEHLCRLDKEAERCKTVSLKVSELVVANSREWITASEWVPASLQGSTE